MYTLIDKLQDHEITHSLLDGLSLFKRIFYLGFVTGILKLETMLTLSLGIIIL